MPDLLAGAGLQMHEVTFRKPIAATATELRHWFDARVQGDWWISPLNAPEHRWITKAGRTWQGKQAGFTKLLSKSAHYPRFNGIARFEREQDAMLFKLTWG